MVYEPRLYRRSHLSKGLVSFEVVYKETDLWIAARSNLKKEALREVVRIRKEIESFIASSPFFANSFIPLKVPASAPLIVKKMAEAGEVAGVGPMAAVAGAIAEEVGRKLLRYTPEIIVENGGDLFLKSDKERIIGVFAPETRFSNLLAIRIRPEDTPSGVCTSSGKVGHSFSFGRADAVVVVSRDAALADAAATAIGNVVGSPEEIEKGLEKAGQIPGIEGVLIVAGDRMAAWGRIELETLDGD